MPRRAKSRQTHTRLKSNAQVGRIFGLAAPLGAKAGIETKEFIELTIAAMFGHERRISELTFDQANSLIKSFGGDPFPAYGNSYRMQNYRKQSAGIKTIETEAHLEKIRQLAVERWGEAAAEEAAAKLAARMHQPWPPKTTEQGNRIVEALKAMNKRDNVVAGKFGSKAPDPKTHNSPSYRRVA